MAIIVRASDQRVVSLGGITVVGRLPSCDLTLNDPRVSALHAEFRYDGTRWLLRPQVTTNGTLVEGQALEPGGSVSLNVGDTIAFGTTDQSWEVRRLSPPAAVAWRGETTQGLIEAEDGVLALPSATDPRLLVLNDHDRWWIESLGQRTEVIDRQTVELGDETWHIRLPANLTGGSRLTLRTEAESHDAGLIFVVSADGDHILACNAGPAHASKQIPVRRHTHLLLELAEARAHATDGWVDDQVLMRRLAVTRDQLHLLTHRAKRQILQADAGLPDPIIETRGQRSHRQFRLASPRVSVRTEG